MNKEPMELTMNEMCKYISIVNKLCETGIMTFDLENCRATVQVNTLTEYLEKQNIELQQRIDKAIELIEKDYYSLNTVDIDSIGITWNKLLQVREILKGEPNNECN